MVWGGLDAQLPPILIEMDVLCIVESIQLDRQKFAQLPKPKALDSAPLQLSMVLENKMEGMWEKPNRLISQGTLARLRME